MQVNFICNENVSGNTEYVDLGLSSGTLWAKSNPDENYYTYREAVEKFGSALPSLEQIQELCLETRQERDNEKGGMWFVGRNGNEIFFPDRGWKAYILRWEETHATSYSPYWSRDLYDDKYAYDLSISVMGVEYPRRGYPESFNCSYRASVRLVRNA